MSIVVYTVILGDYDELKRPSVVEPGVRYICFSDRGYNCPPWEIEKCPRYFHDAKRDSRCPKILAHRFILNAEYSIYHDGSCTTAVEPWILVKELLGANDLALYKHPNRNSVYEEGAHVASLQVYKTLTLEINRQLARYKARGIGQGLWCGGIILRRHTELVKAFNERWWREYLAGCMRDQIALPCAIQESGIGVRTVRENITEDKRRFKFHYHKKDAAYLAGRSY